MLNTNSNMNPRNEYGMRKTDESSLKKVITPNTYIPTIKISKMTK